MEQIRAQQKDFAELKRRTLEPLGQNVSHCNKIGQGLVRSALQGVSTQQLEKDLEKMNDKWNALKEKVYIISLYIFRIWDHFLSDNKISSILSNSMRDFSKDI